MNIRFVIGQKKNLIQRSLGYNSERERFNFKGKYCIVLDCVIWVFEFDYFDVDYIDQQLVEMRLGAKNKKIKLFKPVSRIIANQ